MIPAGRRGRPLSAMETRPLAPTSRKPSRPCGATTAPSTCATPWRYQTPPWWWRSRLPSILTMASSSGSTASRSPRKTLRTVRPLMPGPAAATNPAPTRCLTFQPLPISLSRARTPSPCSFSIQPCPRAMRSSTWRWWTPSGWTPRRPPSSACCRALTRGCASCDAST